MKYWIFGLLAGWMSVAQAGFSDSDLLPVDEAFALEASAATADRIVAKWTIADGYYLYRSKFRFATDAEGIRFGEASYPAGKIKQDEFFGEIETYRHQVAIEIPVIRDPGAPDSFELKATSQGCADIGVCYPPNTQLASLTLAAAAPPAGGALQSLSDLGIGGGFGAEEELLPAEQAFQPDVEVVDGNTLAARWNIAEGYYLYRHKFEFILEPVPGVTLQPAQIPEGEHKTDEFFGAIQVFYDEANAVIPLQRASSAATPVTLTLKYQGCAEIGVCYPPMSRSFELLLPVGEHPGGVPERLEVDVLGGHYRFRIGEPVAPVKRGAWRRQATGQGAPAVKRQVTGRRTGGRAGQDLRHAQGGGDAHRRNHRVHPEGHERSRTHGGGHGRSGLCWGLWRARPGLLLFRGGGRGW